MTPIRPAAIRMHVCRLGLLVALASAAGCTRGERDAPRAAVGVPEVVVIEVQPEDVAVPVEVLATVDGYINAEIRARVAGFVLSQEYEEGRLVQAGASLFTIDPELTGASATQARGDYDVAKARLDKTKLDERRTAALVASGTLSQQDLDDARAAVRLAQGEVKAARGQLKTARTKLGYTTISSPIAGIAGIARVRTGTLVGQADPTLLTTVSQIDPVRVTFALGEAAYLANFERLRDIVRTPTDERPATLELLLPDGSVHPAKGRLELVDRAVDPTTGTITLQAIFPNPEMTLRPGLHAKIRGKQRTQKAALLVPQRAVLELQGTQQLVVIGEGDVAEVRTVEMGERLGARWIVERGLEPGERVVVEGLQKVKNGTNVSARVAAPPTAVVGAGG